MKNFLMTAVIGLLVSGQVYAQSAETISNSAAPVAGAAPESLPSPNAVNALLFDNGPLVNSPGTGAGGANESLLQNSTLGMGTLGFGLSPTTVFRIADDIVVPAPGWDVTTITVYAYQTGSPTTSTMTSANLRIWNGVPGAVGSSVVWGDTTTNVLASSTWSGIYRGTQTVAAATNRPIMANVLNVNSFLAPGTYWLDWQVGGSLASGPFAPPITINGQTVTGNALQFDGAVWNPVVDGNTTTAQGFPFIVQGVDEPPVAVSTLNGQGLVLLGVLLGLVGLAVARRAA